MVGFFFVVAIPISKTAVRLHSGDQHDKNTTHQRNPFGNCKGYA
jgi:hypothetical protein